METLTTMDPTAQTCRIVLRDIGNIANNNDRKRIMSFEGDPEPKRFRADASDSGCSSGSDENGKR